MADIFVSYKSETEKQALAVAQRLEEAGIDCWIACRDIPVGTDYIDEIPMAIEGCPFFLLLLSEKIYISPWVKLELKQAISSGKHILPLMLEDFKLHPSFSFMLQNYQIYPLYEDGEETFRDVIERIYKLLPHLRPQTPDAPAEDGDAPYIFVSFSHKDRAQVMPIVQMLKDKGFRIWLDEGITPGTEWAEEIANRLRGCTCFLPFISANYQDSHACRAELSGSVSMKKAMVSVFLDDARLSPGLQMQLFSQQAESLNGFPSREAFVESLSKVPALRACKK